MIQLKLVLVFLFILCSCAAPSFARAQNQDWPSYGGDNANSKYSKLDQINRDNFSKLTVAWSWLSPEAAITKAHPSVKTWAWESTPLVINGTMYISTSLSQAAAIDPVSGKTKWVYDPMTWKNGTPTNNGFVERGVAYWKDGDDERVLFGTGDGYLIALDAKTGKPVANFGRRGRVDLTQGLGRQVNRLLYGVSSAPVVVGDIVIVGSKVHDVPMTATMPPGSIRGFNVRTGKQVWQFRTVPQPGEYGNKTWKNASWKKTGSANVWAPISADNELGYVYLPVSTPSDDNFGGNRKGDGLFGESILCLNAKTGERIWHYQIVHHGLWDYDPPAAPTLMNVEVGGKVVKALAQVSKQGFVYVLDRVSGKPVWPINEAPVPQSNVPGEESSLTQPIPSKPAAIDRQGVTEDDVVDFTPELHRRALDVLTKYNYGPLYTPPSLEKPTVLMPGTAGGASWAGGAFDTETGLYYVGSNTLPQAVTLSKSDVPGVEYRGSASMLETLDGVPLWKPPYGRVTAIDMKTGEKRWMKPSGDLAQTIPALKALNLKDLGRPARTQVLLTKTLLITAQEGTTQREQNKDDGSKGKRQTAVAPTFQIIDPKISAYDKLTGEKIAEIPLPRNATGAPATYSINGIQYLAVPTGGANLPPELIVLRLPEPK